MNKETIRRVEIQKFDLIGFITDIRRNLSRELDAFRIPIYVETHEGDNNKYFSIPGNNYGYLSPEFVWDDISHNEAYIYVTFLYTGSNTEYGVGMSGNGAEVNFNNEYLGDFYHEDCGYLIEAKDGYFTFKKAHYSTNYNNEGVVELIENAGDFEFSLEEFVNTYIL